MKNIHILPTDTVSTLAYVGSHGLCYGDNYSRISSYCRPQNIYITSDEETKVGDWCFEVHNGDSKATSPKFIDEQGNTWWLRKANANDIAGCPTTKKIILTTDQDLIKDSVQSIPDEFLEWFVKNPSCEEVEVQKWFDGVYFTEYKIIIPKEEPKKNCFSLPNCTCKEPDIDAMKGICKICGDSIIHLGERVYVEPKQETLEEAIKTKLSPLKENISRNIMFIQGANFGVKWQAERSYGEFECKTMLMKLRHDIFIKGDVDLEIWFKQFKKEIKL